MLEKQKRRREFLRKKSHIERRIQEDVMVDGVAHIPCRVDSIKDIVSKFSIKDCTTLDTEFFIYVTEFIDSLPLDCPVVLDIYGPKFSDEQKEIIRETIATDLDYNLGYIEDITSIRKKRLIGMIIGTILSGILLAFAKRYFPDVPLEFAFVIFWLFADAFTRYIFIEKFDDRDIRINAGRLASMTVEFIEPDDEKKDISLE